jgi:hypothetical protein
VQTDEVNGYLLDRGFQVFIESYPESTRIFDYTALNLRPFLPGALVRLGKDFHIVSDPFRRPQDLYASLLSPVGTFVDKLKVNNTNPPKVRSNQLRFKIKVGIKSVLIRFQNIDDIYEESDESTASYLENTLGLSQGMVSQFFSPFYQVLS